MSRLSFWIRISICVLFIFLPLDSLDQWIYDKFFILRGKLRTATDIVILQLDFPHLQTQQNFETTNPFKDGRLAEAPPLLFSQQNYYESVLKNILPAKPKLIVLTTFPNMDHPLFNGALENENIIFPAIVNDENKLVLPILPLPSGQNYGFSNLFPDPDNMVRKTLLTYSSSTSLALRARMKLNATSIDTNLLEPLWIDYRGASRSYETYNARDLEPVNVKRFFENKIVIAGSEENVRSYIETPFGPMTRLEVQANIIDTYLQNREVKPLPHWASMVFAGLSVAISASIIVYLPLTLAWILLLIFAALCFLLPLLAFAQFKIWIGIANPIFSIFSTHLLILGYKLSREEERQWKLQQETSYLKEMDEFKSNFVSLFSHDLKTPIAKIRAITERCLAENPQLPPSAVVALKNVDKTNDELARLISDILKVTQMETRPLKKSSEVLDLNRIVENKTNELADLAKEKNITLIKDLEPLFAMEGDPLLIAEVVHNFIENAIKYSPPQSAIVIRTCENNNRVEFSVTDEGPGIPEDEVPKVTSKFYRGKGAQETTKGSGLGLYLSKYFIELHQGSLEIKSVLGKGTEIKMLLPV